MNPYTHRYVREDSKPRLGRITFFLIGLLLGGAVGFGVGYGVGLSERPVQQKQTVQHDVVTEHRVVYDHKTILDKPKVTCKILDSTYVEPLTRLLLQCSDGTLRKETL